MKKIIPLLLLLGIAVLASPDGGKVGDKPPIHHPAKTMEQTIQEIADLLPSPR